MSSLVQVGKETSGDPALLRAELAPHWPATVAWVKHKTGIDLATRIVQAQGGAAASAGTHKDGAAVDLRTRGLKAATIVAVVAALRDLGWAAWYRDWTDNQHIHAAANLGITTGASYQVAAWKAGFDGLGKGGKGGKDPHPAPTVFRTIVQGAAWAATQLGKDDAMTPEQEAKVLAAIAAVADGAFGRAALDERDAATQRAVWTTTRVSRGGQKIAAIQELADTKTGVLRLEGTVAGLAQAVGSLAAGQGVDLQAVEDAARRGVEAALRGQGVTA